MFYTLRPDQRTLPAVSRQDPAFKGTLGKGAIPQLVDGVGRRFFVGATSEQVGGYEEDWLGPMDDNHKLVITSAAGATAKVAIYGRAADSAVRVPVLEVDLAGTSVMVDIEAFFFPYIGVELVSLTGVIEAVYFLQKRGA